MIIIKLLNIREEKPTNAMMEAKSKMGDGDLCLYACNMDSN